MILRTAEDSIEVPALNRPASSGRCACFSLDASVWIPAHNREGLGRPIRYCARPAFAHERLCQIGPDRYRYDAPKPGPKGNVPLIVSPLELLDRLAAVIPPPRTQRHR